jgi:phage terminase small subunit
MTRSETRAAPAHLRPTTRAWFRSVCEAYVLEEHHKHLLQIAGESWDTAQRAREALRRHGLVFQDRHGTPRPRPEVAIGRDAMVTCMRAIRELRLDVGTPAEHERPARLVDLNKRGA